MMQKHMNTAQEWNEGRGPLIKGLIFHPCKYSTLLFTDLVLHPFIVPPPVTQLVKNFTTFYGTQRFITVFTESLVSW
jgi:hypothetical protein